MSMDSHYGTFIPFQPGAKELAGPRSWSGSVVPKPVGGAQRYMPGLDGLRALAVLAVIAYHLELGWAPGGLLGVGVFFTLSGYLITDLLRAARRRWPPSARRFLAPASQAAPACPDAGRGGGVGHALRPIPAAGAPGYVAAARRLHEQLVEHRNPRLLLLSLRAAATARPPVVPGG